jgi:hypothetical protein
VNPVGRYNANDRTGRPPSGEIGHLAGQIDEKRRSHRGLTIRTSGADHLSLTDQARKPRTFIIGDESTAAGA